MSPLTESAAPPVGTRLAVLWVPDWPVAAAIAEGLVGAHEPVAVHDGRQIVVAGASARAAGVRRGMRRRTAQGLCPDLVLIHTDEGRDVRAFEHLVQAAEDVVAQVQVMRPGLMLTTADGPARYLGSEERVAADLIEQVATATGAEAQVGVADGLLAAVLAARDGVLVPRGGARAYLAGRDVRELMVVATTQQLRRELTDLIDLLRRLGIAALGDMAALRPAQVGPRFGALGTAVHRLAQGLDEYPVPAHRTEPDITAHAELDPPVQRVDVAAFAGRRLAEEVNNRMLRRGVVCTRLRVLARTEDGLELERTWRIDGALTATELTDRVRWQLEGWLSGRSGEVPSAPLVHLELAAEEVHPAAAMGEGLWGRNTRGQEHAGRAALRVQGMLGAEQVLAPVLEGGRTPRGRVRLVAWGDETSPRRRPDAPWPGQIPPPLPATVPTEKIQVELADAADRPVRVGPRGLLGADPARVEIPAPPSWSGRWAVSGWAGPWPVRERWWAGGRGRTYLQVVCTEGPALLLCAEGEEWWVEGIYD
ncbi:DNA polymerase Y family protein [Pseudactinotalea sp. Z1748]|uniref:DNA polymerase Y family protein n=1 Tax=Pseudactinotalea sp. Z1748 TaxID=3413027 RepID=UPI003C7C7BE4